MSIQHIIWMASRAVLAALLGGALGAIAPGAGWAQEPAVKESATMHSLIQKNEILNPADDVTSPSASATPSTVAPPTSGTTAGAYLAGPGDMLKLAFTFHSRPAGAARAIRSGDRLAVTWHFASIPTDKPYKVRAGDWVHLNFRYSPLLSQFFTKTVDSDVIMLSKPYTVEPNGTLVLPGVREPVLVLGKTTDEIRQIVEEKYKGILEVPDVGVGVEPQFVYEKTLQALVQPYNQPPILYVPVPPDGTLSLPLLPALKAEGKTVQQLAQELTEHYQKLKYEFVTLSVWFDQVSDGANTELRELLAGKDNNPLTVPVPRDGHIALPLISDYMAQGKSLAAIGEELTGQYRKKGLDRVEVSAWIGAPRARGVRLMGEVRTPGLYPVQGALDLWGAVAQAGGFTAQADESTVRVVHGGEKGGVRTFNFGNYVQTGDPALNPTLGGEELIFVPRKR